MSFMDTSADRRGCAGMKYNPTLTERFSSFARFYALKGMFSGVAHSDMW